MIENMARSKNIPKREYKSKVEDLRLQLAQLQRQCKELNIPVMIVFEGLDAAGKGLQIGELIYPLDPRGFQVYTINGETKEEKMHPFLWRFWNKTPEKGRIAIFDGSWYHKILRTCFEKKIDKKDADLVVDEIRSFERQLSSDGIVIIKLFLYIDKKEQKKRFEKLEKRKETAWRVSRGDKKRYKHYKKYVSLCNTVLKKTDMNDAPWNIIDAKNRHFATLKIYNTVIEYLSAQVQLIKELKGTKYDENKAFLQEKENDRSMLSQVDLSLAYTKKEYKKRLKELQGKLQDLHGILYQKRIPVVLGFEGWDAAGKGGAIKRLTQKMDPRGYIVVSSSAPNDIEKSHHYLWRYWRHMPKAGHITIFDRTWYGRVMVERIEGFCSVKEWKRAYREINEMEESLINAGAIVIKFWMQIDKEEQKRRFESRMEHPNKQWKITEEDWRNREKWEEYEVAVNDMLSRTSTTKAPWIVVEGNNKYYARIKVLESVVRIIEERIGTIKVPI